MTELQTFATLVARMRQSQRAFFRNKNKRDRSRLLIESKDLEVEVDAEVKAILEATQPPPVESQ